MTLITAGRGRTDRHFRVRRRDRNGQYALAPGCTSEASIEANYGASDLREAFRPGRARPGSNAQSSS